MHEKYAAKGLEVISVSLDEAGDKAAADRAHKFLVKQRAGFTNLLLDEDADLWSAKFDIGGPPAVYVFDRRGKWTKFIPTEAEIDHAAVEKHVVELLAEK